MKSRVLRQFSPGPCVCFSCRVAIRSGLCFVFGRHPDMESRDLETQIESFEVSCSCNGQRFNREYYHSHGCLTVCFTRPCSGTRACRGVRSRLCLGLYIDRSTTIACLFLGRAACHVLAPGVQLAQCCDKPPLCRRCPKRFTKSGVQLLDP